MFRLEPTWDLPNKLSSQESEHVLRVRIIPQNTNNQATMPLYIALAIDTSSSMQGEKLQRAKEACRAVVAQLRSSDRLSLAGFATQVTPLVTNSHTNSNRDLNQAIDRLTANGVTRTDMALDWIHSTLSNLPNGIAKVGILITDGNATSSRGTIVENTSPILDQAVAIANAGITLCTVGLGNAANFNTDFLVSLSDRGQGAFIYADTAANLEPLLRQRLTACQAIAIDNATLKLNLNTGVSLTGFCRFRPEYLPLEESAKNELAISILQSDRPTDILIRFNVPPAGFSETIGNRQIVALELTGAGMTTPTTAISRINFTNSYSEAQQRHEEVDRDRLFWEINLNTTELTRTSDPRRTGDLLVNVQVAAMKAGEQNIAQQAAAQLHELEKSGKLNAHKTTGLLRDSRNLGGV
jgi:Ca-activated chloride channel family protein